MAVLTDSVETLVDEDYIEYDVEVEPNGLTRSGGILMAYGDILVARSDSSNVTVQAWSKGIF